MTRQSASYYRLLGDLSDVPDEYIRDVSHMKRFLERWTMDPKYQEAFASDPEAALTALGIELTPAEAIPLMDRESALEATRQDRADQIVHAPVAFELSKGCTVGCWFCGVAATKFEHTWRYTDENGRLWR